MAEETGKEQSIGLILLAAGGSSRLGRPKQLLPYKGKTLLQYSLEKALASNAKNVVVVLGANAEALQREISNYPTYIVINEHWQEGMASSIRTGIKAIAEINPSIKGVILAVCDQPFMTTPLLNTLIETHQKTGKGIVTCTYDNTFGPPVFFHHTFFSALLKLEGDVGARSIVKQHADNVETVPFPEGTTDIDTERDYNAIKQNEP
jgi:molybdenum cofactor cytidylyltransferase